MGNFNIMGAYSGIDMSVIDQMIEAEKSKGVQFTNRKDKIEREQGAWKDVGTRLNSLTQKTNALNQRSTFESRTVNSTAGSNSAVSVSAGNSAPVGNYQLSVNQLATSSRIIGGQVTIPSGDDKTKPIDRALGNEGSFNFRNAEGQSFQIDVSKGDSLRKISQNINARTKDSGIEASIVDNRLILKDTKMGERAITIESTDVAGKLGFGNSVEGTGKRLTGHKMDFDNISKLNNQTITIGAKDIKFKDVKSIADVVNQINTETLDENGDGIAASINDGRLVLTDTSESSPDLSVTGEDASKILGFTDQSVTHTGTKIQLNQNDLNGPFQITVNGETIKIKADTTVDSINQQLTGTEIEASKKDGILTFNKPNDSEAEISITVNRVAPKSSEFTDINITPELDESGNPTGVEKGGAFSTKGTQAEFTIDGVKITRDTNRISDAIEGIAFTLESTHADGASEVISITNNTQKGVDAMKEFVDQYNSVMNFIQTQTDVGSPGEDNNTTGALVGEGSIMRLQSGLRTTLMQRINGKSMSDFGVEIDRYGVATLDEAKLNEALQEDATSLSRFFYRPELAPDGTGDVPKGEEPKDTEGMSALFNNFLETYTARSKGIISTKNQSYERMVKQINEQIETFNERIDRKRDRYIKQFAALDEAMMRAESQMEYLYSQMNIE